MKEKFFVLVFLILFSIITTHLIKPISSTNNGSNYAFTYKVIKGDSRWGLGMKFDKENISLQKENNKLKLDIIDLNETIQVRKPNLNLYRSSKKELKKSK